MNLKDYIRIIPDFPESGISYKDITPLLNTPKAREEALKEMAARLPQHIDKIVGIESRGFLFGFMLAQHCGLGFVPIRKPGKLPADKYSETYELEYGSDTLEMHKDALKKGDKVVVHDDLLATGGTARAACNLVDKGQAEVVQCSFLIELKGLNGRDKLKDREVTALLTYDF